MRLTTRALTILAALCLIVASAEAAKKKQPNGGPAASVSAKGKTLLNKRTFALKGVVEVAAALAYFKPDQSFGKTKLWPIDLPNVVNKIPTAKLAGRKIQLSFTGQAQARDNDQIRFAKIKVTGMKALDGKPMPTATPKPKAQAKGKGKAKGKAKAGQQKQQSANKKAPKKPAAKKGSMTVATSVADFDPELANVLILGDSISIGYTPIVTRGMTGEANITRPMKGAKAENCGGTTYAREHVSRWLGDTKWDVIHFNFGLHDLKHVHPDTGKNSTDESHPQQASPDAYAENLREVVKVLKETGAHLIFANTTPYPDKPSGPLRRADQVSVYNESAAGIMAENGIQINDLHAFVEPQMEKLLLPKNVHFSKPGSIKLSGRVTGKIRAALGITK